MAAIAKAPLTMCYAVALLAQGMPTAASIGVQAREHEYRDTRHYNASRTSAITQASTGSYSLRLPGSTTGSYAVSSGYSFPSGTAGDFSVEGWIKVTHAGRYMFSYASSSNNNCMLVSSSVGTYGSWVHWAMNVASNRVITHYINGVENSGPRYSSSYCGQSGTLMLAQDQDCVGGCLDANQAPEMWIDSIRVYQGTLSSTEISQLASQSMCLTRGAWTNWAMSDAADLGKDYGSGSQDLSLVGSVTSDAGVTSCAAAATPTPAGGASAVGDPHLQNIHGERFDLMKAGIHVLINIPRGVSAESALLRVQADALRLGGHCADMYFQKLNVTGSWAEAKQAGGYHYSVSQREAKTPEWVAFGKVELKAVHGRTNSGIIYLNMYVKHLGRAGFAVGGLLGEDDHEDASTAPDACAQRLALTVMKGTSSEATASEATASV